MGLESDLGYEITSDNTYVPNGPAMQISLTGPTNFKGLLLYVADSSDNHVGQWDVPSGYKLKNCTGDPKGTLTHSSAKEKPGNSKFLWTPPSSDVGPLIIYCVVVVSSETGFQIIQSPQPIIANLKTLVSKSDTTSKHDDGVTSKSDHGTTSKPDHGTTSKSDHGPVPPPSKGPAPPSKGPTPPSKGPTSTSDANSFKSWFLIELSLFVPLIVSMLIQL
ncbi:35495_t:CDS:2 [Racocetra persica]|uniref:35495_t:CDS:1 n=1 Tax=Racocetra persica TaxID=160502 RepID=A0ACA9KJH6_9GLOM|nr:35495_t:CDS:2 [Racocetra persica]